MLFFRVFDLVVTDAVQALDEHHDGGDAGARDFGGVVQGPEGRRWRIAPVSEIASSQGEIRSAWNTIGTIAASSTIRKGQQFTGSHEVLWRFA
jgi:hypothetical protein